MTLIAYSSCTQAGRVLSVESSPSGLLSRVEERGKVMMVVAVVLWGRGVAVTEQSKQALCKVEDIM